LESVLGQPLASSNLAFSAALDRAPELARAQFRRQLAEAGRDALLAGQRARIRLDGQVMHVITQDGILWRSLPCPIPPGQRHRLQGVRLAGPDPVPAPRLTIQRKVSSRGGIQVAHQRIQVGLTHAGQTVTIERAD
jgi:hypothetical protein